MLFGIRIIPAGDRLALWNRKGEAPTRCQHPDRLIRIDGREDLQRQVADR